MLTEHPALLWDPPGPWHSSTELPSPGLAAVATADTWGGGRGWGHLGSPRWAGGLIPAIPSSWEGEGRVKQSAERRRGARRQPGYWKPPWPGSHWDGCGEELRALTALRPAQCQPCHPWVQAGPATSPQCHPQHRGSEVPVHTQPWESPAEGLPKGCLVSSQVDLGLLRGNPGQGGSWEWSRQPVARCPSMAVAKCPQCPELSCGAGTLQPARTRGLCWGQGAGRVCTHSSAQHRGKNCKRMRSHPRLSNRAPLEGNLAHSSPRFSAKSCWERGFARGLGTPRG